ncbi:hypothetical protein K3495_g16635, partial [Podosphaera aphanis]
HLRDFLCSKGVYVKKVRLYPISNALIESAKEELQWPQDDPERPKDHQDITTAADAFNNPQSIQLPPQSWNKSSPQFPQNIYQTSYQPAINQTAPVAQPIESHTMPSTQQLTANFRVHNTYGNSRELTKLTKLYTNDSQKYNGTATDNITYKYSIFLNNGKNAGITFDMLPSVLKSPLLTLSTHH